MRLFSPRRSIVNYEEFLIEHKKDSAGRHLQFIGEIGEEDKSRGIIYSHSISSVNGHVFIGGYIPREFRGKGHGAISLALLISYLFEFFPLHKIYFETVAYNEPSLRMLKNFGFIEEGVFKDHHFYDGKRYDFIRMAAYRDCLVKVRALLVKFEKRG